MKLPRIGELASRVVLESEVRTPDGGGGATIGWVPVAEVWASVRPLAGRETFVAEALSGRVTHAITIRWRGGVVPAMRLRLGDRTLAITAVLDIGERRRFLQCLCREEGL